MEPKAKRALITDHFRASANSNGISSKDFTTSFNTTTDSPRYPTLDEDVQSQLIQVGMRARKAVSEGYKMKTSFPSYQGGAVIPEQPAKMSMSYVDFSNAPSMGPTMANKSATVGDTSIKRTRDEFEASFEGLPVQDDTDNRRVFYTNQEPTFASNNNSIQDDFEEATFLAPHH